MPKYCQTYEVMCHSAQCAGADCQQNDETRMEAEAIRGVRLTRSGKEISEISVNNSPFREEKKKKKSLDSIPTKNSKRSRDPKSVHSPPSWEAIEKGIGHKRAIRHDALIVSAIAATLCFFVGIVAIAYVFLVRGDGSDTPSTIETEIALQEEPGTEADATGGGIEPAPMITPTPEQPTPLERAMAAEREQPAASASRENQAENRDDSTEEAQIDMKEQVAVLRDEMAGRATDKLIERFTTRRRPISAQEFAKLEEKKDRGNELRQRGNLLEARSAYQQAIEENPNYYEGYNNLGNTYADVGAHDEAQSQYTRGLRVEPQNSYLHYNIGLTHFRQENYLEAYRRMKLVTALNPDDKEAQFLAGIAAMRAKEYFLALEEFNNIIERDPENAYAHLNLGVVYREMGQTEVANVHFRQASDLQR